MYLKNNLNFTIIDTPIELEQIWIQLKFNGIKVNVGTVYRAPATYYKDFISIFESTLTEFLPDCDKTICLGDFNIDFLSLDKQISKHFIDFIESIDLEQIINQPTRLTLKTSTLLDLILGSDQDFVSQSGVIPVHALSDHDFVYTVISVGQTNIVELLLEILEILIQMLCNLIYNNTMANNL